MHVLPKRVAGTAIIALLAGLLALAAPAAAQTGETFYVTLTDGAFTDPQLAECTDATGGSECSIRDAIDFANSTPSSAGVDVINFLFDGPTTITLDASGLEQSGPDASITSLDVLTDTIINGEGVTIENVGSVNGNAFTGGFCDVTTFTGLDGYYEEGGVFTVGERFVSCFGPERGFTGADEPITLTVNGLTVTGGEREFGGGYLVHEDNALILADGAGVVGNLAYKGGGGVFLHYGATLDTSGGVEIVENQAGSGDPFSCCGPNASGGGIGANYETVVTLDDTQVNGNRADGQGGGIATNGELTVTDSTVDGNGAGIYEFFMWAPPGAQSTTSQFNGGGFGGGFGGGIAAGEIYFDTESNGVFCNGGTGCFNGNGSLVQASVSVSGSSVSDNTVVDGAGGGLFVLFGRSLTVTDSTVARNGFPDLSQVGDLEEDDPVGALMGGGILSFETPTVIDGSDVTDNQAALGGGGVALESFPIGMRVQEVPSALITDSTIQGNVVTGVVDIRRPTFAQGEQTAPQVGAGLNVVGFGLTPIQRAGVGLGEEFEPFRVGVHNSTFDGNEGQFGTAMFVCDVFYECPGSFVQSFFNAAVAGEPEPTQPGVELSIGHVSIVDNVINDLPVMGDGAFLQTEPQPAHGIFTFGTPYVTTWNTLIQDATGDGSTGAACSGVDFGPTPVFQQLPDSARVTSWGGNSAGDETCNFTATGDAENQTDGALLGNPAADVFVRPLPEGHSAIDAGIDMPVAPDADAVSALMGLDCNGYADQIGVDRPIGEACDRGAVEFQPEPVDPVDPVDPTDPPNPGPGDPDMPDRVGGPTRLETAVLGSQSVFGDSSTDTVVLARSDQFPDAQAGTPLAVELDAPLLLTQPNVLSTPTQAEIERVTGGSGTIVLLGGVDAIEAQVEDRLQELGYNTVRYGGANRFATAVVIATDGLGTPDNVLLADGGDFHPSIIAGAAAVVAGDSDFAQESGQVDAAVLLTAGSGMAPETADYLDSATQTITTIGAAATAAYPAGDSVGADAVDDPSLSVMVADAYFDDPVAVGIATTVDFADALSGSSVVGNPRLGPGPMLFSEPDGLPDVVSRYLMAHTDTIERTLLMGGTAALSEQVEADVEAALGGG